MAGYLRNAGRIIKTRISGSGELFTKPGKFIRKTSIDKYSDYVEEMVKNIKKLYDYME